MSQFSFHSDQSSCNRGDEYCPAPHDTVAHYTQLLLNGQCLIPDHKPDSKKFVSKHHTIKVHTAKTISSVEIIDHCRVEGKKVMVAGIFELGIEYSDKHPTHKVHFFSCDIPFQGILLPCCGGEEHLFPENFSLNNFNIHVCVEDLQVKQLSPRSFEKTIVLMIWLQPR